MLDLFFDSDSWGMAGGVVGVSLLSLIVVARGWFVAVRECREAQAIAKAAIDREAMGQSKLTSMTKQRDMVLAENKRQHIALEYWITQCISYQQIVERYEAEHAESDAISQRIWEGVQEQVALHRARYSTVEELTGPRIVEEA